MDTYSCSSSYIPSEEIYGWCQVSSVRLSSLLSGTPYVSVEYKKNPSLFTWDLWKSDPSTGLFSDLFRCSSNDTTMSTNIAQQVIYTSSDLICYPVCEYGVDVCTSLLTSIVKSIGPDAVVTW